MFETMKTHGIARLDTARLYTGSEQLINDCGVATKFSITTKAAPFLSIKESANESFKALGVDKVDVYLLHGPDGKTPEEVMNDIQPLYEQGHFNKFGISNFSAEQVRELYDYSKSKGYILPTVYQSNYNLVAKKNERLLFPTLRELGLAIQAYSPAAGGYLLKSPEQLTQQEAGSRWADATQMTGKIYDIMYNKPSMVEYSKQFGQLAEESGVGRVGLAYRWVKYHLALTEQDTIIIGARTPKQLDGLLTELEKGPLEEWVVQRLDGLWNLVEKDAPVDNLEAFLQLQK